MPTRADEKPVNDWPVVVQTRSPLVLRDLDIILTGREFEVGFSVTSADDAIRRLFEPNAPPIPARIEALDELHRAGVRTYAMIAPMLPGVEGLLEELPGKVDNILIDRLNYSYANRIYMKYKMGWAKEDSFFIQKAEEFKEGFLRQNIPVQVVF